MKKLMITTALIFFIAGCATPKAMRIAVAQAARAVYTASDVLADAIPVIAEKARQEMRMSGCANSAECMRVYDEKMATVTTALKSLRLCKDALFELEAAMDLYDSLADKDRLEKLPLIVRQVKEVHTQLAQILADLEWIGVTIPSELYTAMSLIDDLLKELEGRL